MSLVTGHSGELALLVARAHGVETMFTLSGAHVFPMYDAAVQTQKEGRGAQVRLLGVRHEQTAAFAAEATGELTRVPGLADRVATAAARDAELLTAEADPIHPARIYGELVPRLEDDSVVIGDGGDVVSFAGEYVEPKRPGGWLDPGPYGCLGAGLGAAIAARIARPGAQLTLLLGDGAAAFSLIDVDTLVRHDCRS